MFSFSVLLFTSRGKMESLSPDTMETHPQFMPQPPGLGALTPPHPRQLGRTSQEEETPPPLVSSGSDATRKRDKVPPVRRPSCFFTFWSQEKCGFRRNCYWYRKQKLVFLSTEYSPRTMVSCGWVFPSSFAYCAVGRAAETKTESRVRTHRAEIYNRQKLDLILHQLRSSNLIGSDFPSLFDIFSKFPDFSLTGKSCLIFPGFPVSVIIISVIRSRYSSEPYQPLDPSTLPPPRFWDSSV